MTPSIAVPCRWCAPTSSGGWDELLGRGDGRTTVLSLSPTWPAALLWPATTEEESTLLFADIVSPGWAGSPWWSPAARTRRGHVTGWAVLTAFHLHPTLVESPQCADPRRQVGKASWALFAQPSGSNLFLSFNCFPDALVPGAHVLLPTLCNKK